MDQQQQQQNINKNLEQVFDLEPTETQSTDSVVVINNNNKPKRKPYTKKAPTRGGARKGAGRPKGSSNKITVETLVLAINKEIGISLEEQIAMNYKDAIDREDHSAVRDYDKFLLSKVVATKHEIDHTTLGESIKANFNFQQKELPDWSHVPTSIKLK